jgi:hypothetical protein
MQMTAKQEVKWAEIEAIRLTATEIAPFLDCSASYVSMLEKRDILIRGSDGKYSLVDAVARYTKHLLGAVEA